MASDAPPAKRSRPAEPTNAYRGWHGSEGIATVPAKDLSAERFFAEYVSPRRPVVLDGAPSDEAWQASKAKWGLGYLKERAGGMPVKVERAADASGRRRFGLGSEEQMRFGAFLDELERGSEAVYLTTQETASLDASDAPDIMGAPLLALRDDFPLRPELAGGLVPASVNLWLGRSRDGASSGLHHDYHDNLYVLLAGQKRFRLFSPRDAHRLYVKGDIETVHPNGRICYAGRTTFADGHDAQAERAAAAAQALADAEDGGEDAIEAALEAVLEAEMAGGAGEDDESAEGSVGEDEEEDEEEDEAEISGADIGGWRGLWEGGQREAEASAEAAKDLEGRAEGDIEGALEAALEREISRRGAEEGGEADAGDAAAAVEAPPAGAKGATAGGGAKGLPDNFSEADLSLPTEELHRRYPLLREATMLECTVRAGQMLYLPAGWFHEVTSFSTGGDEPHMAFNYWFHPPDADSFEKPYSSSFWEDDFAERFG